MLREAQVKNPNGLQGNYLSNRNLNFVPVVRKEASLPKIETEVYRGNVAATWSRDLRRSQDRPKKRKTMSFELEPSDTFDSIKGPRSSAQHIR